MRIVLYQLSAKILGSTRNSLECGSPHSCVRKWNISTINAIFDRDRYDYPVDLGVYETYPIFQNQWRFKKTLIHVGWKKKMNPPIPHVIFQVLSHEFSKPQDPHHIVPWSLASDGFFFRSPMALGAVQQLETVAVQVETLRQLPGWPLLVDITGEWYVCIYI